MTSNDVIVPFDIELARRIKNRSIIGEFLINGCNKVEFVYESIINSKSRFLFVKEYGDDRVARTVWVNEEGIGFFNGLLISVVKIKTDIGFVFHDGDVLMNVNNRPFIFNGNINHGKVGGYCGITNCGSLNTEGSDDNWTLIRENEKYIRKATEKEEADFAKILLDKGGQRGGKLVAKFMSKYMSLKTDLKQFSGEVVSDSYIITLQELSSQAVEKICNLLDCCRQEAFLIIQEWAFEFVKSENKETEYDSYYDQIYKFIDRKINDIKEKLEKKI